MGRTLANKKELVAELKQLLSETESLFVIDYKGLTVAEISDLRNRIREKGGTCKIAKNTLINIAVEGDENWQPVQSFLKDTTALLLTKDDIGGVVKEYKKFQKDTKKTELRGGVLEGKALSKAEAEAIADLPSKEELYAKIAGALNALAAKVAIGVKEV
ncbi:MAG: 50S ribosomal protein L10, partial [Cyanobacteria bacterium P01_G01_bin.38]